MQMKHHKSVGKRLSFKNLSLSLMASSIRHILIHQLQVIEMSPSEFNISSSFSAGRLRS